LNTDNVYLVILLVLGIVILANLGMFALVRGWRSMDSDWLKKMRSSVDKPFKNDESLDELHKRVEDLKKTGKKE